ncbi:MAG: M48 family metallopeptidase [Candidatus Aenigmarchaeota archaeon]|nr:M48 family metallopeptidase [Candidatus Aenigmarchaeota archaeon]
MPKIKYPYEFDPQKRKIAKEYRKDKLIFYLLGFLISLFTGTAILVSGLHLTIKSLIIGLPLQTQIYGLTMLLIFTLTGLPLAFYSTYIHDRRYNISRYSLSGWLADLLKGSLISYIISLIMITLLYFTIGAFSQWWIYASIFYIIFWAFLNYVYPFVIVPFMWKTEPYKDTSMKEKILKLCRTLGVTGVRKIVVIKESEKSVRPNAIFMGFGGSKSIGLFDTLLDSFTKDEVETVVGHELGHYASKDVLRGLVLDAVLVFPTLYVVDYLVRMLSPMFGISSISSLASLPLIGLVYGTIEFFLMPILNMHSRWRESEADKFALVHVKKPVAQISTEKRLADYSLSQLTVNPMVEFWFFTHPVTLKRIQTAEKWKGKLKIRK